MPFGLNLTCFNSYFIPIYSNISNLFVKSMTSTIFGLIITYSITYIHIIMKSKKKMPKTKNKLNSV